MYVFIYLYIYEKFYYVLKKLDRQSSNDDKAY